MRHAVRRRNHPPARSQAASRGRTFSRDVPRRPHRWTAAPPRRRSISCSRAASARTGIASMPRRSGIITRARRWCWRWRPTRRPGAAHEARAGYRDGRTAAGRGAGRHWQAAESLGDWTLVGCTVAPGFEFAHFEMAPKDWAPRARLFRVDHVLGGDEPAARDQRRRERQRQRSASRSRRAPDTRSTAAAPHRTRRRARGCRRASCRYPRRRTPHRPARCRGHDREPLAGRLRPLRSARTPHERSPRARGREAEAHDRIGRHRGEAARQHRIDRPGERRDERAAKPGR